ncbi:Winged helix-turn helix [Desulfocicer vacuolatum DSM 3385]|uniref:Winged helix-turn helix n=1 Tax=Desulfocicer vacuolatum DSM 3385 TaxID=1121400 RepID=A0A1W2EWJ1_9BACT|nr:helix-turn-helix domain-containing protein [Desulfocicer vacuolatum]SMD14079.1 Winged helix-turn helix [Desulfocicer vacuolatum DSM 3385]
MKLTVKEKLMLLELATVDTVSAACAYMNVSRDTYYRIKKAYDEGGVEALAPKYRRVPNLKNRVADEVEENVLKLSAENPEFGKKKISRILKEQGHSISPNTVKAVLERNA